MNKVILMGRLTRDPEVRYTQTNNTLVASFSLAVNRRFARQGEERQADFINIVAWSKTAINRPVAQDKEPETDFINVVLWNKQAENVAKYVTKGGQVAVEGRIQTRSYENNEGKKIFVTEVIASNVEFLQTKKNDTSKTNEENTTEANDPYAEFGDSITTEQLDLPF